MLASVAKVLAKTKRVLDHFKASPTPLRNSDFQPYVGALLEVCRLHRKPSDGIDDLQQLINFVEDYPRMQDKPDIEKVVSRARTCVARYSEWLRTSFPEIALRA